MMIRFTRLLLKANTARQWPILSICLLIFSCSDSAYEKEKEEGAESIRGFDLWSEMRTYPGKSLNAKTFVPAFEQSLRMDVASRGQAIGRELPTTAPWVNLAPMNFSGRILSIAIDPTNPNVMFVGSASGGIWKTTNGGHGNANGINWTYVPTGFPTLGVASLAINPSNNQEIYAGTGEVYNPGALAGGATGAGHIRLFRGSYGIGILKSTNGGTTWTKTLDFSSSSIKGVMDLLIHPTTPTTVFAATSDGVYRTINSGLNWTLIHTVPMAMSMQFKPDDPNTLYVGSGNFNSANAGIYRSTNANAGTPTFTQMTTGLPTTITGKIQLSVTPANVNYVYASIGDNPNATQTTDGLYRSTNAGTGWTAMRIGAGSIIGSQGWYAHDVCAGRNNANLVLWGELNTYRSTDGGTNVSNTGIWSEWDPPNTQIGDLTEGQNDANPNDYVHADVHRIICSPHDATGNTFFLCTDGGIFRTTNGGQGFETLNGGLVTAQIYANMAISPNNPNYMLLGLQDNESMVYEGNQGSRRIGGLGDGFHSAIKSNGVVQLVESYYFSRKRSTNSGASFGASSGQASELACFNVPMVYSQAANSTYMFAGTIYFKRSVDDGATWTNPNGATAISGVNNPAIAMAAPTDNRVYLSTAPGGGIRSRVYRTTNATAANPTLTNITGTLPDRYYSDIAVDPTDATRIAVTLSGFGSSHVFLSNDGGNNWCDIGAGLPDVPTNTVTFDPDEPGTIYIGNDIGVYYAIGVPTGALGSSYGLTWTAYNEGLGDAVMVSDLLITSTNKVRLGSYGRGLWERDMAPATLLPAVLHSINVVRKGNANELNWVIQTESDVQEYQVEYSTDGRTFSRISAVPAKGNAGKPVTYSYLHQVSEEERQFYRVKILDRDGSKAYTDIVQLKQNKARDHIYLFPNPAVSDISLHLPMSRSMQLSYRVLDAGGRQVLTGRISAREGVQQVQLPTGKLPAGIYRVVLESPQLHWTGNLIKK